MTETDALMARHSPIHPYRYAGNSYSAIPNYIAVPNVTHLAIHDLEVAGVVRLLSDGRVENLAALARNVWRRSHQTVHSNHFAAFSALSENEEDDSGQILHGVIVSIEELLGYGTPNNISGSKEASDFLNKLYRQNTKKAPKNTILETIQTVFAWVAKGSFETIDAVLNTAKVDELAPELIVTLLRSTITSRDRLSGWQDFLSRARVELKSRSFDIDVVLQGL
jgi:hypothetical protein